MFHLSMSCALMFILFPHSTSLDMLEENFLFKLIKTKSLIQVNSSAATEE